ncbi:MAG: transposase [Candidatus Paceibacterota bacterium]|jgi:REP element-mobilizing transposase RayT
MATRKTAFANGEFYHIYNRGVDKRIIFSNKTDVERFLQSMILFNSIEPVGSLYELSFKKPPLGGSTAKSKRLVNIIAYCLNPNHFHFVLEQVSNGGISEFMKRLSGGYTWYFNNKNKRSGALFQGRFKSIHIDSNEYLLHVSAYVNLNDQVHQLGGSASKLVRSQSSWGEYIDKAGKNTAGICVKDIIFEQFRNRTEYKDFAISSLRDIVERRTGLKDIENILLE